MERVYALSSAHPGKCPLFLCLMRPDNTTVFVAAHERFGVTPSLELEHEANRIFGEKTYYAIVDKALPEKARRSWEKKPGAGGGDD